MTTLAPLPPDHPRTEPVVDGDSAQRFVDTHIAPVAGQFDRDARIPDEFLRHLSDAGLWAPFLPPEVGGAGVSFRTLGRIHEEVGRGCSSIRSLLTVHSMAAWAVNRWGTPAQRERWLPQLASGATIGAVCITEPQVGSDATRVGARAARAGDGWVVSGTKTWITAGQCADLFLVFAQTERGLAAFLVPRDAPGVEVTAITEPLLGTRASMPATVALTDATVGADALLGPEAFVAGMVLSGVLDIGRYSVAAGSIGIVQACLDASVDYSSRREINGTLLRDLPLIRAKITDMVTDVTAGRLLYERAGALKDDGDSATIMATWMAKYFAASAAARHASQAVQIHGAVGCADGHPVARCYRDSKIMEIIEGSTEIQQLTIADVAYQERHPR
jgi:alkylation response protein AidB-like acyl-CoA dehydrogenase